MGKRLPSSVSMAALFLLSNAVALLLAAPASALGYQALPEPENPWNPVIYLAMVGAFTAVILFVIKKKRVSAVKWLILAAMAVTMVYVFSIPLILLLAYLLDPSLVAAIVYGGFLLAILVSAFLTYLLVKRPEWYVVDAVGVSTAAGVTAILGISFGILPAFILLILLAVYDAWAVYHTKHMVALADAVTSQRLPVLLVIPKKEGYSFLDQKPLKKQIEAGEEREAMFMGLGDIIIPGILVVSAFTFLASRSANPVAGLPASLWVALGALAGALCGYAILMRYVEKGDPQAGLPLLNGGALAGYAVAYLIVFRDLSLGLTPG